MSSSSASVRKKAGRKSATKPAVSSSSSSSSSAPPLGIVGSPPITRETPQFYIDPRVYVSYTSWHKEDLVQVLHALSKRNREQSLAYIARCICAEPMAERLIGSLYRFYYSTVNIGCLWILPFLSQFYSYYQSVKKHMKEFVPAHTWCNDQQWRNFAFFVIPVMCHSTVNLLPKTPSFQPYDFDFANKHDIISQSLDLIQPYILPDDDKTAIIPLSEIINYLSNSALPLREEKITYWLYWLLAYEKHAHAGDMICSSRTFHEDIPIASSHDWVWIVWHILLDLQQEMQERWLYHLFILFVRGYAKGKKKNRMPILMNAVRLFVHVTRLTEPALYPNREVFREAARTSLLCNITIHESYSALQSALAPK
jgi:hypothetical protein